jgi:hypothetical protein
MRTFALLALALAAPAARSAQPPLPAAAALKERRAVDVKRYAAIYDDHFLKAPFNYKDATKEMERYFASLKTRAGATFFAEGRAADPKAFAYAMTLSAFAKEYPELGKLARVEKLDGESVLFFETALAAGSGPEDFGAVAAAVSDFARRSGFRKAAYATVAEDNFEHQALLSRGFARLGSGATFAMKWQTVHPDGSIADDDHRCVLYLKDL